MGNMLIGFSEQDIASEIKRFRISRAITEEEEKELVYSTDKLRGKKGKGTFPEDEWNYYITSFNGNVNYVGMRRVLIARMHALDLTIRCCGLKSVFNYFKREWPHWFKACIQSGCDKPCRALLSNIIVKLCLPEHVFYVDLPPKIAGTPKFKTVAVGHHKTASVEINKTEKKIFCFFHPDRPYYSLIGSKEIPICEGCRMRLEDGVNEGVIRAGISEKEICAWLKAKALNDALDKDKKKKK